MINFKDVQAEYQHNLQIVKITRPQVVIRAVDEIERLLDSYAKTGQDTGIPTSWIGPTDCRESDCNPRTGIGQGDPWNHVSIHVPKGEGPFSSKAEADKFYLHYDHIDVLPPGQTWTLDYAVYDWERWNGWGPRLHGRVSGYPWSCTNIYDPPQYGGFGRGGKYVADGVWDADKIDPQPGTVPMYMELIRRHPSLAMTTLSPTVPAPPIVPVPVPEGTLTLENVAQIHDALNKLLQLSPPFPENDTNYDRGTYAAVRIVQQRAGFTGADIDGIVGPKTRDAMKKMLLAA